MFIRRVLEKRIKKLFKAFPIVVLVGARQVGKTTLLTHLFDPPIPMVTFDPLIDIENARTEPELFLQNHKTPLILDEIQYAPELLPTLKRKIDQKKGAGQYLLTGSQQWSVIRGMAESLAGRAIILELNSFSLSEIAESKKPSWLERWLTNNSSFEWKGRLNLPFPLFEQLWRGFLPKIQELSLDLIPPYFSSYIQTYIERDVRLQANIQDLSLFHRFIRLTSALSAQEVSFSQLGREIGLTPQTSKRWIEVLKGAFQWFEVESFSRNPIKKLSQKPKGYFMDTGLIAHLNGLSSPSLISSSPLWGPLFETAVVSEIRKQCFAMETPPQLFHFRALSGAEVDLILEKDGRFFPIEIKASAHPKKSDTLGLQAFKKRYSKLPIERSIILAPTEKPYWLSEDIYVLPWDST